MTKDLPPDHLIERAVELWCRKLRRPVHDNGDSSERGLMTEGIAGMLTDSQIAKVEDYPAAIEKFRGALIVRLKFMREHDGEPSGETDQYGPVHHRFDRFLSVDYNPDPDLAHAAQTAGIPARAFSWKSSVYVDNDHVQTSFGYAAPYWYHYRLDDGSWLVCQLRGEHMPFILAAVNDGRLPTHLREDGDRYLVGPEE